MSTLNKLNRILQTKQEIYEAIAEKGIDIDASTPFEEVASIIDEKLEKAD